MNKKNWILLLLLIFLVIIIRLPSFDEPMENDSGANAFFARQLIEGQRLYDVFHPAHHLPGIYYTFELAFRLFGDHPNSPKLLLLPWTIVCALLLYHMGRIYLGEQTGVLAAVFFVLVSSQRGVAGMTVEMEHFANLPLIAGILLLVVLCRKQTQPWQFVWIGILSALGMLYKVTLVAPVIIGGIAIALMAWLNRKDAGVWKIMFSRWIWLAIGVIIPLGLVAAYFAGHGLWERLILVFELGFTYMSAGVMDSSRLLRPFGYPLYWMSINNFALLFLGLIGTYKLARRSFPVKSIDNLTNIILLFWLLISLAIAGLRGGGFPHYCLPVIPPLALVASVEVSRVYRSLRTSSEQLANLSRSAVIATVLLLFLWSNYSLYREHAMYKLNRISHDEFLQSVYMEGFISQELSNYIKKHTKSDDFIYLWSIHIGVYYYADRMPPIDFLWPAYAGATGSPNRIFDVRTKYIIVDLPKNGSHPEWLTDGLAASYELETTIADSQIYRRIQ